MNVYFISGFAANCHVFDLIVLPPNYEKIYIEWYIPKGSETLEEYAHQLAQSIDKTKPFVLLGYSLGGMIVQEMNKFLHPTKTIIVASIKSKSEIPPLLRLGRRMSEAAYSPIDYLVHNNLVVELFTKYIYLGKPEHSANYLTYTDPVYVKWALLQIFYWVPTTQCQNLYHIHGTNDPIFPYKYMSDILEVEKGDHLMIMKKHRQISRMVSHILLDKHLY